MTIKKYLAIGAVVQAAGMVERKIRGVSPSWDDIWEKEEPLSHNLFGLGAFTVILSGFMAINIATWPIYIISEGYNIYKGE